MSLPTRTPGARRARAALFRALAAALLVLPLAACDLLGQEPLGPAAAAGPSAAASAGSTAGAAGGASATATAAPARTATPDAALPYDVRPLLKPAKKYLGVAVDGAPASMAGVDEFAGRIGKRPNIVEYYSGWGDEYDVKGVTNAWQGGALPFIAWEPYKTPLADIAAGKHDDYVKRYAAAVRNTNVPVAISFAHEFNGTWYDWGTKTTTAADFVAAYQHLHDVFTQLGVGQVIWVWSPNSINPVPTVALKPYYPGDTYVDWVGIVAYYTHLEAGTFDTLYTPTLNQIRTFTDKPWIIAETGSEPGTRKVSDIYNLAANVIKRPDCLGFIWFNLNKEVDWRIEGDPQSQNAFKQAVSDGRYSFDVKSP
ncbi:glycoside hydrolase family 26 protein [Kitasatospora sp. NPDC015120]|uniref:glycoside hydrolase family 26 protein n=1 Tax=Kitasatospora sp. NPDC015120 TaxID=3364023 RepID=UPI0036F481C1